MVRPGVNCNSEFSRSATEKRDTGPRDCSLCKEQSLLNAWQITTAPADAPMIASQLDLGPATGAAPSGQPTNNTTAPADALEIASSLDLGPAGAKARRSKLAQPNSTRGDPPSPGSSQTTGMAAGAPDGVVEQLPAFVETKTPNEYPLAATAEHGEIVTPSTGETPAPPSPPPSAHGLPRGSPAPAASARAHPASASKPKTKKAKRRQARPHGGKEQEDLEADALAWLAAADADADAAAWRTPSATALPRRRKVGSLWGYPSSSRTIA